MRVVLVLLALPLGLLVGGAVGFLFGMGFVALTDVSCFEGACGYAAMAWMLAGALAGLVIGPWAALRLARRRRP